MEVRINNTWHSCSRLDVNGPVGSTTAYVVKAPNLAPRVMTADKLLDAAKLIR